MPQDAAGDDETAEAWVMVAVSMKDRTRQKMEEIAKRAGHETIGEMLGAAVSLYEPLQPYIDEGADIIVHMPDGRRFAVVPRGDVH